MVHSFVPASLLMIVALTSTAHAQTTEPKPAPAKDERLSRDTPEGTLRLFMLGVLLANEDLVKATIVPVSKEDLAYLTQKTKNLRSTPKQLKEACARMKVRALKPGDVVTLPGGKKVTVTEEEVTDKRMVLVLGDGPVPTRLYKAKGYWWVDASPVIASRKATAKHSQEAKEKQKAEIRKLEGTWEVVSIEVGVKTLGEGKFAPDKVVIKDDKVTFFAEGKELPTMKDLRIELVPNRKPKAVDLTRGETQTFPCLYEATADGLKLAMPLIPKDGTPDDVLLRPESFETKDKPIVVLAAKRSKG